jgi:hypothetical protein
MASDSVYILFTLTTFKMSSSRTTPADRQNPCHQTSEQAVTLFRNQVKQMLTKIRKRKQTILNKIDEFHKFSSADIYLLVHVMASSANTSLHRTLYGHLLKSKLQEKNYPLPHLYTPAFFKVSKRRSAAKGQGRAKEEGRISI